MAFLGRPTNLVAILILLVAGARMLFGDSDGRFDQTTLLYLFGAAAVLLLARTKTFQFGDLKFELEQMKEEIKEAKLVANIAQDAALTDNPVRETGAPPLLAGVDIRPGNVHDDPWKGVFGGDSFDPVAGRTLTADVEKLPSLHGWYSIRLTVASTPGASPLTGPVQFFLHDSFANDRPVVRPMDGRAVLHLKAWGAFTVGVLCDDGRCRLELDLAGLETAPWEFRSR